MTKSKYLSLNLAIFGDGSSDGSGETASAAGMQTSTEGNPTTDLNAEFEALIKGKYKDQYNSRVSNTVRERVKNSSEIVSKYEALAPTLQMLGKKYGVDASDIKALNKAIEEDDSYYEDEALEKGVTVEQLKEWKKIERENSELKAQMAEQERRDNANKLVATWMSQAESVKAVYPSFNLETEIANPKFAELLKNNIDVRTAYEVVHKDEILPAAMQFAAKQAEVKLANNIRANANRPTENGLASQSGVEVVTDVSKLSPKQRAEYAERAMRGERITF